MATFSKKLMGKEVGQASTYAKPHTMSGKVVTAASDSGGSPKREFNTAEMSVGNIRNSDYAPVKTSGIKTRGNGAATKGVTARGPMA
jgi:hypothetical protein